MLRQSARAGTATDVWPISQRESWWRGIVNLTSSRWSAASELKEIAMTRSKTRKVPQFSSAHPFPYVTHFVFRPLMNVDVPGVGSVATLEAVGTTENLKG